jgi:hypothetical protein
VLQDDAPTTRPLARTIALAFVLLAGIAALGILIWGATPVARARGHVVGKTAAVVRVVLSDPQYGVLRPGTLNSDGSYSCGVPRAARVPMVFLHGEGTALVRSPPLELDGRDTFEIEPLALWTASTRIREKEGVLRFDWGPIPKGEGFPNPRRYSLLLTYTQLDGSPGESSLLSREPSMTIPRQELIDLLKDWDPAATQLTLSLRAFDPTIPNGALWVGGTRAWDLAPTLKATRDSR